MSSSVFRAWHVLALCLLAAMPGAANASEGEGEEDGQARITEETPYVQSPKIVVDTMLATANSAIAAIDKLKGRGATNLRFLCLLAAPEGIERFTKAHPDVPVFTASIYERLNEKGYIVPGLGDAGDRMYGTK